MATLQLDHIQRLNLVALLDTVECAGVREIFAVYKLQESIDLDAQEKESIHLIEETVNGNKRLQWDAGITLAPRKFEIAPEDIARIRKAIETWKGTGAPGQFRGWLQPLWAQLNGERNGDGTPTG